MEIRELRLGNILDVGGNYWQVSQISDDELYLKENEEYNHILNAEPIPLTEDILTKCGIYQSLGSPFYRKGKFAVDLLGHCEYKNVTIDAEISYIHTLQNIYFALTQQELEIKL